MRSILLYHNIARRISPFGSTIPPSVFESHIKYLLYKGIELITMDEYLDGKEGIVITFDDGFEDPFYFLPEIIERYNIKPLIFIVSGYIGRTNRWDVWPGRGAKHLNKEQIKELRSLGVEFGSHSHTHIDLSRTDIGIVKREMERSKMFIEDITGEEVKFFSFPFGRWKKDAINIALELGYKMTFASTPIRKGIEGLIGRWGVYIIDPLFFLPYKRFNGFSSNIEYYKLKLINFFSNGTYYAKKFFS